MGERPPWPPASVAKLLADPSGESLVETLLEQVAPDPESRAWLVESWSKPKRPIDGALLAEIAGGGRWPAGPRASVPGLAPGRVDRLDPPALPAGGPAGRGLRPVMIRVVLENLVKRYDEVAVVDGASMEVRPGELSFVLGPSGSGKTTLARLIAGLEPLDDGEIYFDGRLVHELPPQARRVGLVFQDDALWPHLTVAENVGYPLKIRGRRPSRPASRRWPTRSARPGSTRWPASGPTSSPGLQRQRVALARALVLEPDLLILDDPLGRLEARVRDEFLDEIRRVVAEAETTTLILTSDAREALAMADHLAVMDLGRIVQSGQPGRGLQPAGRRLRRPVPRPDQPDPGAGRVDRPSGRPGRADPARPPDRPIRRRPACQPARR